MAYRVARSVTREREEHAAAAVIGMATLGACVANPGLGVGALATAVLWHFTNPPASIRWVLGAVAALAAWTLLDLHVIHAGYTWNVALHGAALPPPAVMLADFVGGPAVVQLLVAARWLGSRSLMHTLRREEEEEHAWIARGRLAPVEASAADRAHPAGRIRLGFDARRRGFPFDLELRELAQHVFLPGASGSGKTTTLARIADGCMANGYSVVIVDCKGGGLGDTAESLASRYGVRYTIVDPDDERSIGYNPCAGSATEVTNKLLGAFTYEGAGEVYKLAAGQALPPIVRGLMAAERPVTLDALAEVLKPGGLARLGRDAGPPHDAVLKELEAARKTGGVGEAAYTGLQYRLGMLQQGKFGDVFRADPALVWDSVLDGAGVTYVALSATAASEDVELMGRVIAQDLKQLAARRLARRGVEIRPVLIVFDEFAALREAEQIVDLLLQARQARMQVVVSTQYLPELVPIRKACLSAGLIVAHRLESEDAEAVAGQFGTRQKYDSTLQIDRETGFAEKGSVRKVDVYNVHPNELRNMPVGRAAVRSVPTDRRVIVDVLLP